MSKDSLISNGVFVSSSTIVSSGVDSASLLADYGADISRCPFCPQSSLSLLCIFNGTYSRRMKRAIERF